MKIVFFDLRQKLYIQTCLIILQTSIKYNIRVHSGKTTKLFIGKNLIISIYISLNKQI